MLHIFFRLAEVATMQASCMVAFLELGIFTLLFAWVSIINLVSQKFRTQYRWTILAVIEQFPGGLREQDATRPEGKC
jgi:hypothetical protein